MIRFIILFSLLVLTSCSRYNQSKTWHNFLADNWDLSIDEWKNWTISYQAGKNYYLATVKSETDSTYSKIMIIPGDSLSFMLPSSFSIMERKHRYSIQTLIKDSVNIPISVDELLRKSVFVIHNDIISISCWNDLLRIEFRDGNNTVLFKTRDSTRVSECERIDSLWYIKQ